MISAKKILLLIFAIFLGGTVLLIGYLAWNQPDTEMIVSELNASIIDPTVSDSTPVAAEAPQPPPEARSLQQALETRDESLCHQIPEQAMRSECFDRVRLSAALSHGDPELCQAISAAQTKHYCTDTILLEKAIAMSDARICAQITHELLQKKCREDADQGVLFTAEEDQDCAKMSTPERQNECQDELLFASLNATNSSEQCNQFRTTAGRTRCADYFREQQAITQKDPTLCLQVQDPLQRTSCEQTLSTLLKTDDLSANILQGKSEYCAEFQDPELKGQCEDEANYYAAKIYRQTDYCQKIHSQNFATRCVHDLTALNDEYWLKKAQEEKNPEHCTHISAAESQAYCRKVS